MTIYSRTKTKEIDSEDVSPRRDIISERDYYHSKAKTSKQRTQPHVESSVFCIVSLNSNRTGRIIC